MGKIDFPTSVDTARPHQDIEVVDIYTAENPKYGKNGLWIVIKNLRTGNENQRFFPDPPSAKATALLEGLEKLGVSPKDLEDGWESLVGYKFSWVQEEKKFMVYDRDDKGERQNNTDGTPKLIERTTQVEYPVAILERPGKKVSKVPRSQRTSADNGETPAEAPDWEALSNKVAELADGKTLGALKFAARNTPEIKGNTAFSQALVKGEVTDKLIEEGVLTIDEEEIFHIKMP